VSTVTPLPTFPTGTPDLATPVTFDFSVEPCENDRVLYMRVAPRRRGEPARAALYLALRVTNYTARTFRLTGIELSFPGSYVPTRLFARDENVAPGTREEWLGDAETIEFTSVPPRVRVRLLFGGGEDAVAREWPLARHATEYDFFAKPEADADYGECLYLPGGHLGDGGPQHFGHDVGVYGWNRVTGELSTYKTDGATNADTFLWERPIYAMADGVVLKAVDKHPDNPSPDERSFRRADGSYQSAYDIAAVAAVGLAPDEEQEWSRLAVAVARAAGGMRLLVLEHTQDGDTLRLVDEADGPPAEQVAVARIPATRIITAARAGTAVTLTLWRIPTGSTTLSMLDSASFSNVTDVKVVALASDRALTASRTTVGTLNLAVWDCSGESLVSTPLGVAGAGAITDFEVVALGATRFVTAVRQGDGVLKLIVWDVEPLRGGGVSIVRRDDAVDGAVHEVALSTTALPNQVTTAARRADGTLDLATWDVSGAGTLTRRGSVASADEGTLVQLGFFKTKSLAAAFRTPGGDLRVVAWNVKQDETTQAVSHTRIYARAAGAVDRIAVAQVLTAQRTFVTAVRTQEGRLKVILWQYTDSNLIYILHGNELVCHVHLRQNSIPDALLADAPVAVRRGDLIGRMGHSGKSSGPHLHIHAVRVHQHLLGDIPALRARVQAGESVGAFRPLQFRNVQGMRYVEGGVRPGVGCVNPVTTFDGHGAHFDGYVVWPWAPDPECGSICSAIAALGAEIAELEDQRDTGGEPYPSPGHKPAIYAQIGALKRQRDALRAEAAAKRCL
jgi:hypothetical protein